MHDSALTCNVLATNDPWNMPCIYISKIGCSGKTHELWYLCTIHPAWPKIFYMYYWSFLKLDDSRCCTVNVLEILSRKWPFLPSLGPFLHHSHAGLGLLWPQQSTEARSQSTVLLNLGILNVKKRGMTMQGMIQFCHLDIEKKWNMIMEILCQTCS